MKQLSNKEIHEINGKIHAAFCASDFFSKKDKVFFDGKLMVKNKTTLFAYVPEFIPTLHNLLKNNFLKTITIDMNAVKFIVNGADIMRPGIVAFDELKKDEIIAIVDEKNRKPLAVGKALVSSDEMKKLDKGKVVKNLHWIGDEIWRG